MSAQAVCEKIHAHSSEFLELIRRELLNKRDLIFAGDNPEADYITAITYFINHPEDISTAKDMGEHQRIYGDQSFLPWAAAVNTAIRELCSDLSFTEVFAAEKAILTAAKTMEETRGQALQWRGRIVDVVKPCRRVSIVRMLSEEPIPYYPGQYLAYTTAHAFDGSPSGEWRHAHVAIPPNDACQLEFHLFHDLTDLGRPHNGDHWILSPGMGNLFCSGQRDILMIAQDTGVAGALSMILALGQFLNPPRVHLFVAATYPGELYALRSLWQIAAQSPWLSVTPVSEQATDAWWVSPTAASAPPRGLHLHQVGRVEEIIAGYGTWDDRDILIFGTPERTAQISSYLIEHGTPKELIQQDTIR